MIGLFSQRRKLNNKDALAGLTPQDLPLTDEEKEKIEVLTVLINSLLVELHDLDSKSAIGTASEEERKKIIDIRIKLLGKD